MEKSFSLNLRKEQRGREREVANAETKRRQKNAAQPRQGRWSGDQPLQNHLDVIGDGDRMLSCTLSVSAKSGACERFAGVLGR